MPTLFPSKQSGEKLYAAEVNAIYTAINNLELALDLTAGTPLAAIPSSQLASGIAGEKIDPQSTMALSGLTVNTSFSLNGWGQINAATELGSSGFIEIIDHLASTPRPILTFGRLSTMDYGVLATNDDDEATFRINRHGQVTVRGQVFSTPDSVLRGSLYTDSGDITGSVQVGGVDGVTLDGSASKIVLGSLGQIVAGDVTLSAQSGIQIYQGLIDLGNSRFVVDDDGALTAKDAIISGTIDIHDGSIGGIDVDHEGIHVGGSGSTTTGFALTPGGYLYAKQGSFTGEVHAESGSLGNLDVEGIISAGAATISPQGIDLKGGSINLGNGRFVVDGQGNMTANQAVIVGQITATSGQFEGDVTAGNSVTLSNQGIHIHGEGGLLVQGQQGIKLAGGSVTVLHPLTDLPILFIGNYQSNGQSYRGILVKHGVDDVFRVTEDGDVFLKGAVEAESGSFRGTVHAEAGSFDNISVIGDIVVSESGRIIAGDSEISHNGIFIGQGSINLNDRFIVTEAGHLTATNASIEGYITATGGHFVGDVAVGPTSGIIISGVNSEIIAGDTRLSPTGLHMREGSTIQMGEAFSLSSSGHLVANSASIRGSVEIQSGSVTGHLQVGGAVLISPDGIAVAGAGGVELWGGSVVVKDLYDETMIVELGSFSTSVVWPNLNFEEETAIEVEDQLIGVGDGDKTEYYLGHQPILVDSLKVRIDYQLTQDYQVDYNLGRITFNTPPDTDEEIRADYRWIPKQTGMRVFDGERDTLLVTRDGKVYVHGAVEAVSGHFGEGDYRIHIDSSGIYSGILDDPASPFGIYISGPSAGSAYFRGSIRVTQDSFVDGDISVNSEGRIYAGDDAGARLEMTQDGLFAYDVNNSKTFQLLSSTGMGMFTGTIYATGGNITGDLMVGTTSTHVLIKGSDGQIIAGGTTLSPSGLHMTEGQINLNNAFVVDGQGHLTSISGNIGGITVEEDGIHVGGLGENTAGFSLSASGELHAKSGSFTGAIHATEGTFQDMLIEGKLTIQAGGSIVAGGSVIDDTGIHLHQGTITLGSHFEVDDEGKLTASEATIKGTIEALAGKILGDLHVGLSEHEVSILGSQGKIKAGQTELSSSGLHMHEGTINLGGNFVVTATGSITAKLGLVGGWEIGETTLSDGNSITLDAASGQIRVSDDSQDVAIMGAFGQGKRGIWATQAEFGIGSFRLHLDDDGLYSKELDDSSASDSPFGIYISGPRAGDAYFRGSVAVTKDSMVQGDMFVGNDGAIFAGSKNGARVEMTKDGLFAYDTNNAKTFELLAATGAGIFTGAINATGGTIKGNLTITHGGSDIRIVGDPVGVTTKPGVYIFEPGSGTGIIRLTDSGLQFSTNGGSSWHEAVEFGGIRADAIRDGTFRIEDSGQGAKTNILVTRVQQEERATLTGVTPFKLTYDPIEKDSEKVTSLDRLITYERGVDYVLEPIGGRIQRTPNSSIPNGATVFVTYTHHRVEIDSQKGITIHDGSLEVRSSQTGTTLISGGAIHVQGLDVGVYQSDNFISNGNFGQMSSDWGVARLNDGGSIDGLPPLEPGEEYYGDWIKDRMGRVYRYGSAFWIPDKSDTTYDQDGHMSGYAKVAFAPQDFLHQIYGYAEIELGGSTEQWGQIEQDVYPWYNHSDGDFIISNERFKDVVGWMDFHWHATHTAGNTVTLEMDELVPRYVFVEPKRIKGEPEGTWTPVWDNVFDEQEGIEYSPGWEFVEDPIAGTGDNVAYGCSVSSNATIKDGTEGYAVDWHFVRESWATETEGSGHHYLQVDLGEVQPINHIWVWHSTEVGRKYRSHKIEVSKTGDPGDWETVFDSDVDGAWSESQGGKIVTFDTKQIRYIRDWIDGFEYVDSDNNVVHVPQNQWLEIQARHCGYMITHTPGAWAAWTFSTDSRADLWVGYLQSHAHGDGYIEIDGVRIATVQQGVLIGGDDHHHELDAHARAYVDVSSQANFQMVPRKKHTMKIVFDNLDDEPDNEGKSFTLCRIKLEDFQLEGPHHTSQITVASHNVQTSEPYGFYTGAVTPRNAKNFTGRGRQILKGMWDSPRNFSPSSNCWLRYRLRVRSHRAAGGDPHTHDHVMISAAVVEIGTKPTHFRRSSLDLTPSHFLQEWDDRFPNTTGVRTLHLADGAITSSKLGEKSVEIKHLADDFKITESKLELNYPTHAHINKGILDQIAGWGTSGTSLSIARADHDHDDAYLKLSGGQITGNITISGTINGINLTTLSQNVTNHIGDSSNPHNTTAAQVGALSSIKGIENPGGDVDIVAGTNISVTADTAGKKITIAHSGNHDNRYYTKTNLSTNGQAEVHWGNLNSVPDEFPPVLASSTVRGGVMVGAGLTISSNERLSVVYAGTGSASSAARSDHHHNSVYARLDGSTITGATVFTATENAIRLTPSTSPSQSVADELVTLHGDTPASLSKKPIHASSEVVKSENGQITYERDVDYSIDYWGGTIVRTGESNIPSGSQVRVSYLATKPLFRITSPAQADKLVFDSEGNILAHSVTVSLTRTQEQSGGQVPGDFSIIGNLSVSGSSDLGGDPSSITNIVGSLTVWGNVGSGKLFEIANNGTAMLAGSLDTQGLTVNSVPVSLEGHDHNELYYTQDQLSSSGQATVHWNNLSNRPATATRWPTFAEVTGKPSSYTPSAHAFMHAAGGPDPITPAMIGAEPALGFTPVNRAGDTIMGLIKLYTATNESRDVLRIGDRDNSYGFNIRYTGDQSGNENGLEIWSDNATGTPVRSLRMTQDGVIDFLDIKVGGNTVWHAGNDGSGSGLDADLLDGQQGSYYRNASNLNAGTLPAARFTDTSHGNRGGGSLHAAATTSAAGFMSAADKAKLNGIAAGAEVNQNAFSNVLVGQTTVAATSKTDTLQFTAGDNISITANSGQRRVTISAAHDHDEEYAYIQAVPDRLGAGVAYGLRVKAQPTPGKAVDHEAGLVYLPNGLKVEIPSGSVTVEDGHGQSPRIDVVFVSNKHETSPNAHIGVKQGQPSANPQEPVLEEGEIKLATILVPVNNKQVTQDQISDAREYLPVEYNEDEAVFRGRKAGKREVGWTFDGAGNLQLSGKLATNNSSNYVDISQKAPVWDEASKNRHIHIYNEVPVKDTSDATGKSYLLRYEPAADDNVHNGAQKRIMVWRNGLLQRPTHHHEVLEEIYPFGWDD